MKSMNTLQKVFVAVVISMLVAASGCAGGTGLLGDTGMFDGSKLFSGFGDDSVAAGTLCSGST